MGCNLQEVSEKNKIYFIILGLNRRLTHRFKVNAISVNFKQICSSSGWFIIINTLSYIYDHYHIEAKPTYIFTEGPGARS